MKHIYTIVCARAPVDASTNNVSAIDILERITMVAPAPPPSNEILAIPLIQFLVISTSRSNPTVPETGEIRVVLVGPDGTELMKTEYLADLSEKRNSRAVAELQGMPIKGTGDYEFVTSHKDANTGQWSEVARYPIEIVFKAG